MVQPVETFRGVALAPKVVPNKPPTIDAITPNTYTFPSNAQAQTVLLSGITPGLGESMTQTVTNVTASSSNPNLVNLFVDYTPGNSTGTITVTPLQNVTGTATITVTVMDDGGTENGGVDTTTRTFTVTITPNNPPTLAPIMNPPAFPVNSPTQDVTLTGIGPGVGDPVYNLNVATAKAA